MIVRRHVVDEAVHPVSQGVVGDIRENENILAAAGFVNHALALARAETDALRLHPVIIADISLKSGIALRDVIVMPPEGYQIIIDFISQRLGGGKDNKLKRGDRDAAFQLLVQLQIRHGHTPCFYLCDASNHCRHPEFTLEIRMRPSCLQVLTGCEIRSPAVSSAGSLLPMAPCGTRKEMHARRLIHCTFYTGNPQAVNFRDGTISSLRESLPIPGKLSIF